MKNVSRSQHRISVEKNRFVQKYNYNWKRIQSLVNIFDLTVEDKMLRLKGLKSLSEGENNSFFDKTFQEGRYKYFADKNHGELSWIWEVAMLDQPGVLSGHIIDEWESEGASYI